MVDQEKKGAGLFLWISHEKITLKQLKNYLEKFKDKKLIKFKSEPPIVHIVCKTLEDAKEILEKGFKSGWKKSGIINIGRNIVVELHGTEKLEFPIMKNGEIIVSENFLKIIIEKSNKKMEKGWKKIQTLEKLI